MLDKRYQVFLCTSGSNIKSECTLLWHMLIGMGFFPWAVDYRTPMSTALARRQIDECDYVVLLLGNGYGDLSASGVSYQHLEYIYAVTKQKPMIVLMQNAATFDSAQSLQVDPAIQTKFLEFRALLQQEVEQVYYYQNMRDLESVARLNLSLMIERHPTQGWIRSRNVQEMQDEIDHLRLGMMHLEAELDLFAQYNEREPVSNELSLGPLAYEIDYRVQAYSEGHFQVLELQREMSWDEILHALKTPFSVATPEEFFFKKINQYLNETALKDVILKLPNVHTVASSQIKTRCLLYIKQQLRKNHWIVPVGRDERQRQLWKMTKTTLDLLEQTKKPFNAFKS